MKLLEKKTGDFTTLPKERRDALKNQMIGEELERKMSLWLERKKTEAHVQLFADAKKAPETPETPAAPEIPEPKKEDN